jgi:hypothetical protein
MPLSSLCIRNGFRVAPIMLYLMLLGAVPTLGIAPAFAGGLKLDVDACPIKRTATTPRGELFAQAEALRASANQLRQYDYDRCFRLERSCFIEIDSKLMSGIEDESYKDCRNLEPIDRDDEAIWLKKKEAFIGCVVADLEKRAKGLEGQATDNDGADRAAALLEQIKSRTGAIDRPALKQLGENVTWCSTRDPNRVRVLCKDGTGLLANNEGQQFILWRVTSSGQLCFVDFDGLTTCRSVSVNNGQLTLTSADGQVDDVIKVVPRIAQSWSEGCSQ